MANFKCKCGKVYKMKHHYEKHLTNCEINNKLILEEIEQENNDIFLEEITEEVDKQIVEEFFEKVDSDFFEYKPSNKTKAELNFEIVNYFKNLPPGIPQSPHDKAIVIRMYNDYFYFNYNLSGKDLNFEEIFSSVKRVYMAFIQDNC